MPFRVVCRPSAPAESDLALANEKVALVTEVHETVAPEIAVLATAAPNDVDSVVPAVREDLVVVDAGQEVVAPVT